MVVESYAFKSNRNSDTRACFKVQRGSKDRGSIARRVRDRACAYTQETKPHINTYGQSTLVYAYTHAYMYTSIHRRENTTSVFIRFDSLQQQLHLVLSILTCTRNSSHDLESNIFLFFVFLSFLLAVRERDRGFTTVRIEI